MGLVVADRKETYMQEVWQEREQGAYAVQMERVRDAGGADRCGEGELDAGMGRKLDDAV